MKRARQVPERDEPEPSLKHRHYNEEVTLGPFTAAGAWNDFWIEVLKYFASLDLWKLSCVSKPLFGLTWNLLIPNFTGWNRRRPGMRFTPETPLESMEKYLSRAGGLRELDLWDFLSFDILSVLTRLTKLSFLAIPLGDIAKIEEDFPVNTISHLTNLTGLAGFVDPSPSLLANFFHLKNLEIWCSDPEILPHVNQMTSLVSLILNLEIELSGKELRELGSIHHLTRLQDLRIFGNRDDIGGDIRVFGIRMGECTNLKKLYVDGLFQPEKITGLTNLGELGVNCAPAEALVGISKNLTNLRALRFFNDEAFRSNPTSSEFLLSIMSLKSLEKLCITTPLWNPTLFPMDMPNLRSLKLIEFTFEHNSLVCLSNLTKLAIKTQSLELLSSLTQLKTLELFSPDEEVRPLGLPIFLSHLEPLTNLKTLTVGCSSLRKYDITQMPTSLTSLTLRECTQADDCIDTLEALPQLKKLRLLSCYLTIVGIQRIADKIPQLEELSFQDSDAFKYEEKIENEEEKDPSKKTFKDIQPLLIPLFSLTRLESLTVCPRLARQFWHDKIDHHRKIDPK